MKVHTWFVRGGVIAGLATLIVQGVAIARSTSLHTTSGNGASGSEHPREQPKETIVPLSPREAKDRAEKLKQLTAVFSANPDLDRAAALNIYSVVSILRAEGMGPVDQPVTGEGEYALSEPGEDGVMRHYVFVEGMFPEVGEIMRRRIAGTERGKAFVLDEYLRDAVENRAADAAHSLGRLANKRKKD